MYKLVIADDEEIIRDGIIKSVPWAELGFIVAGEAADGSEVLKKLDDLSPHVILTDIKMPEMDGIQLIEHLNEYYPDIKIVILSGYSEVEYFKKAIKNRVADYILKPSDYNEFVKVFQNLKKILDGEKQKKDEYEMLQRQLLDSLPFMKDKFLKDIVTGFYTNPELISQKSGFYDLKLPVAEVAAVVIEPDNQYLLENAYAEEYNHLMRLTIADMSNRIFCKREVGVFFIYDKKTIGIVSCIGGLRKLENEIQEIQRLVNEEKSISISAGIGNAYPNISDIGLSFKQAIEALRQRIFLGPGSVVFYRDITKNEEDRFDYFKCSFDTEKVIDAVFYDLNLCEGKLYGLLNEAFIQFEHRMIRCSNYIDSLCLELLFAVSKYARQFGISLEDVLNSKNTSYYDIGKLDSIHLKRAWLLGIFKEVSERMKALREDDTGRIIADVKKYIRKNYSNNGISLETAAETVNKNPAYISKLFKMETGENFIDYLTKMRVETAKELFRNITIKTYEVSSTVGYADVSHFTKIFKKYTGLSPTEYREVVCKT